MAWEWFEANWPIVAALAVVGYVAVTCVLHILATRFTQEIAIHDRIRESRALRLRYLASLEKKSQEAQ